VAARTQSFSPFARTLTVGSKPLPATELTLERGGWLAVAVAMVNEESGEAGWAGIYLIRVPGTADRGPVTTGSAGLKALRSARRP
jgi:hypothetical protein